MDVRTATNPSTGEKQVYWDGEWVKYDKTATNPDTGDRAFFVDGTWVTGSQISGQRLASGRETAPLEPAAPSGAPQWGGRFGAAFGAARAMAPDNPVLQVANGQTTRLVSQGGLFGAGDELAYGAAYAAQRLHGNEHQDAADLATMVRDDYRDTLKQDRRDMGAVGFAAEMAGGLATGGTAARGVTALARQAPTIGPKAAALLSTVSTGAGAGFLYGDEDRALGTAIGAAAGPVLAGTVRGGQTVSGAIGSGVANLARTPQERAINMVARRMKADGFTEAQIMTKLREWQNTGGGITEYLTDLGSDRLTRLGRALLAVAGPGQTDVRKRLIARMTGFDPTEIPGSATETLREGPRGAARRIIDRAARTLAIGTGASGNREITGQAREMSRDLSGVDFQRSVDAVLARARAEAGPRYEAAIKARFPAEVFNEQILPIFQGSEAQAIVRSARRFAGPMAAVDDPATNRALEALARGESPAPDDITVGLLHMLKMGMDDVAESRASDGARGAATSLRTFIRTRFLPLVEGRTGNPTPEHAAAGRQYEIARQTMAQGHRVSDAMDAGARIFSMTDAQFSEVIQDLGQAEREAMARGALRALAQAAGKQEQTSSRGHRLVIDRLLSPENQRRLQEVVVGDDPSGTKTTAFNNLMKRVRREREMMRNASFQLLGQRQTVPDDIKDATHQESGLAQVIGRMQEVIRQDGVGGLLRRAQAGALDSILSPGILHPGVNRETSVLLTTEISSASKLPPKIRAVLDELRRLEVRDSQRAAPRLGYSPALAGQHVNHVVDVENERRQP